ncbi:hypothetical protein OIO90_002441 [Microbotryomycetes sp. JL221]|nr:hypothetical protein OIO90_002441 [Microbotryomycetes sp. JL221]
MLHAIAQRGASRAPTTVRLAVKHCSPTVSTAKAAEAAPPPSRHSRSFATTTTSHFLFRRPRNQGDPRQLARELIQAKHDDRLDVIARVYPALVSATNDARQDNRATSSTPYITHANLQQVMRFVALTNRFNLLLRMFDELESVFGFRPTSADHHILVLGMAKANKLDQAISWLKSMPTTHGLTPQQADWNVVLAAFKRRKDLKGMTALVDQMRASGIKPDTVTYNTLIAGLFDLGMVEQVRDTIKLMQQERVEPDLFTETALLTGFLGVNEMASATQSQQRLKALVDELGPGARDAAAVNALVKFASAQKGFSEGLRLAVRYKEREHAVDSWTINTLALEGAKNVHSADEASRLIDELEQVLGVPADRRTWGIVLQGVLIGPEGLKEALKVHEDARLRSVQPDAKLVQPLLSALLEPSPTSESMAVARELYEDLANTSKSYQTSPDLSIYVTLLRACAHPAVSDLDFSRLLLSDMRQRGLKVDGPTMTWQIIGLMRTAQSWEEAFAAYDETRALDVSALDAKAYNTILAAFTSLKIPNADVLAPSRLVLEFLSDMRTATPPCPPDSVTYSMLLSHYSKRVSEASASHVSRLHSLIKLDSTLDPDTALFNSLMAAYSRVASYQNALRIWDSMIANSSFNERIRPDHVTLSIVLDTCGYANDDRRAIEIWDQVKVGRAGAGLDTRNVKNWDSFVECMCRCKKWDEAERAVFEQMGSRGEVEPQSSTLQTLLKMSRTDEAAEWQHRWQKYSQRAKEELPHLWNMLDEGIRLQGETSST